MYYKEKLVCRFYLLMESVLCKLLSGFAEKGREAPARASFCFEARRLLVARVVRDRVFLLFFDFKDTRRRGVLSTGFPRSMTGNYRFQY